MKDRITLALVGNPNCGKTALFNALTGSRQKVGNWPGVTVEKKNGEYRHGGRRFEVVDLRVPIRSTSSIRMFLSTKASREIMFTRTKRI